MADFCKQCSEYHFGKDSRALARPGDPPPEPEWGYEALCEGCGPTFVDEAGVCVYQECPVHGQEVSCANL
jgi:hypothetical protein